MILLLDSNMKGIYHPARLDPRANLFVWAISFITVIFASPNEPETFIYLIFLILTIFVLARTFLWQILKDVLRVYPMIFLITMHLPFNNPDTGLAAHETAAFTINPVGLTSFLEISVKSIILLCLSLTFVRTISHGKMISLLHSLRLPNFVISILSYLRRLVRLMLLETERIKMAAWSRNLKLKGNGSLKRLSQMLQVYFIRLADRSDRTYMAMLSRGFTGQFPVTDQLTWHLPDSLFILISSCMTLVFWIWQLV